MKLPHKTLEKRLFKSGYKQIIAVDEVGMGSLAGPVVVCAVFMTAKFYKKSHKKLYGLRDSKLLAAHQREKFANELFHVPSFMFHVSYCYPKTIDRINIYQAARLAMRRAIARLAISKKPKAQKTIILVDGKTKIKSIELDQLPIVKGDRKVFAIACASIIAKVYRDKMMTRYAKKYPQYGFEKHKGYGTKMHRVALMNHGSTPIHRQSFTLI